MIRVLGIDPGFTGALAVILARAGEPITLDRVADMPLRSASRLNPANRKNNIDVQGLAALIYGFGKIDLAVVENVHAAPDQGVVSMFRFGEGLGMLKGILAANLIRMVLPVPSVWKASMNVTAAKSSSLIAARALVGPIESLALAKHHGRAEAILLAAYGIRGLGLNPHGGDEFDAIT